MVTLEMVEKLREKANVSYDEAKLALEATGGDLLDALIYLEKEGRVIAPAGGGYYNSEKESESKKETVKEEVNKNTYSSESFVELLKRFGKFCAKVVHKGNTNTLEIYKGDEYKTAFPITALVLFLIFLFWLTVPLLITGLFFGFHYRFNGPDLGKKAVNDVMDSAANAAENLKKSINNEKDRQAK